MKIKLEIPDIFEEKAAIRIFVGNGIVARKMSPTSPWEIKTQTCSYCGKCCMNVPEDWMPRIAGRDSKTGHCKHLTFDGSQYRCGLEGDRPFSCCYSDGNDRGEKNCTIVWQTVTE